VCISWTNKLFNIFLWFVRISEQNLFPYAAITDWVVWHL